MIDGRNIPCFDKWSREERERRERGERRERRGEENRREKREKVRDLECQQLSRRKHEIESKNVSVYI